ncbi:NRDE family protein [Spirosoma arcticum]
MLTHSRDEKAIRPAAWPPQAFRIGEQDVTFPQDPQSQGTWIAVGRFGTAQTTACLLNGAFALHQHQPPYKHSRGLVIPHFFEYPSVDAFTEFYDFNGIEPFTLLIIEKGRLIELKWNGIQVFTDEKDPYQPHIWSSVTLYTPDVVEKRKGWFRDWVRHNPRPSVNDIRQFHRVGGDGDTANSLLMNRRNGLLTISLTSVVRQDDVVDFIYEDFTQHTFSQQTIRPAYAIA